ncbi:MAG: pitrilysin family protein [bacterium]
MKTRPRQAGIARVAGATLVAAALLLTAAGSDARAPKQIKFPPIEFKTPRVDTLVFANGMHGYLIEDHEIPVVNIVIKFKTGFPPADKTGLNDVAGWALRNAGTGGFAKETLDDQLEFVGASIESYSGNYVGQVSTNFLTKDTDMVLEMFAQVIANPAFQADKIELKKGSMIEQIRRKADDPSNLGHRELSKLIYRNHPAGLEPTAATVSAITRDDLAAFHSKYVRPNNAVIGISGDISKQEALDRLTACLASWQPGGETPYVPEMEYAAAPTVNYIYKDLNQAYIWVGHMSITSSNPDLPLARIMNYILGSGSFSSWIIKRVRSDEGLAYDAGSHFGDSPWGYGIFSASCQTRTDAAMRALKIMLDEIDKMRTEGPNEEEVATARDAHINSQVFDYESSSGVADRLAWFDIAGLPLDTLERDFRAYQAATLADVKRVGSQYLRPNDLTILVIGNQDLFDRPLSDFGEVNVIELEQEEVPVE